MIASKLLAGSADTSCASDTCLKRGGQYTSPAAAAAAAGAEVLLPLLPLLLLLLLFWPLLLSPVDKPSGLDPGVLLLLLLLTEVEVAWGSGHQTCTSCSQDMCWMGLSEPDGGLRFGVL
jgi:hypothetical protein